MSAPRDHRAELGRRALLGAGVLAPALLAPTGALAVPSPALVGPSDPCDPALVNPAPAGLTTASPLARAHAHNDYLHRQPLWDALEQGFTSVEADVWHRGGKLLLGHTILDTVTQRRFEQWYVEPLAAWVRAHRGEVHPGWGGTFQLLVDIKEQGSLALPAIEDMLAGYHDVLARVERGRRVRGAVQVVYSGNRPFGSIADRDVRYGAMDGHAGDLDAPADPVRIPLISEDWQMLGWQGIGPMPADQRERLSAHVQRVHAAGARARFWGNPELLSGPRARAWDAQLDAGVDLISTDHLAELRAHLLARGLA